MTVIDRFNHDLHSADLGAVLRLFLYYFVSVCGKKLKTKIVIYFCVNYDFLKHESISCVYSFFLQWIQLTF